MGLTTADALKPSRLFLPVGDFSDSSGDLNPSRTTESWREAFGLIVPSRRIFWLLMGVRPRSRAWSSDGCES